jgi:hypothetical protein
MFEGGGLVNRFRVHIGTIYPVDIEERAEKWVDQNFPDAWTAAKTALVLAYLAGSAQTQADYAVWALGVR